MMATRLTIKAETDYKNIDPNSTSEEKVIIESYSEDDNLTFHLETMVKFLLGCGYSLETIQKYLSTDGAEVWEIGE